MQEERTATNEIGENMEYFDIEDINLEDDLLDADLTMPAVIWNQKTQTLRFQNCSSFNQIRAIGMQYLCKVDEKQVCKYCNSVNIEVEDGEQVIRFNIGLNKMNYKKPKEDRIYREAVGRVLCSAVKKAVHVERVICGIGQCLKGGQ